MSILLRCIVFATLAVAAPAGWSEPLSFPRALELAEQRSALLEASTRDIDAARASAIPAAALPDPKLVMGIENFPVTGPDAGQWQRDSMTMQKVGLMQEIPNGDKRRARAAVARAAIDLASAQWRTNRQAVRRDAAMAWIDLYYLMRQSGRFGTWEQENVLFARVVNARIAAGGGSAADAVAPGQEAAQLADRRDDLVRDIARARAALRMLVDRDAEEPLSGEPPVFAIDPARLRNHLQHHPELVAFSAESRKAEAEVAEARSLKKPDWGIELDFARRAPQFGNMVSLQFTIDLPLATASRQDPLISARREAMRRVDAERERMLREHASELDSDLAEYAALSRQRARAEHTVLPLAEQKVVLQMASYQAGKSSLDAVLTARRERIEENLRILDLQRQVARVAARLHFAYEEDAP